MVSLKKDVKVANAARKDRDRIVGACPVNGVVYVTKHNVIKNILS